MTARKYTLKLHIEQRHEQSLYPCKHCDYAATHPRGLKDHMKRHDKNRSLVLVTCDQCEFKGTQPALSLHKRTKHLGIRYSCDQCDYSSNYKGSLKKHKEYKHQGTGLYIIHFDHPPHL